MEFPAHTRYGQILRHFIQAVVLAARPTAAPRLVRTEVPWHPGNRVRWRDRAGTYRRDAGDGEHVEIVIAERVYRVRRSELLPG